LHSAVAETDRSQTNAKHGENIMATSLTLPAQPLIDEPNSIIEGLPVQRQPTSDEIAVEAYALFEARGRDHGRDMDDWFEAEQRVRARAPSVSSNAE
jgi:hypothetical protein